ncbi:MAG: DUF1501 domain-containing protein [Bryobacterales bacterium]|nr:DUF1501 domain-containing protein [Bryobacterales bacterium]
MNTRRDFLRTAAAAAGMLGIERFGMMSALAQTAPNYKALVCVFLFGGNDGHNTVVPMGTQAYNAYKAARGGLALPTANTQLLPVNAANGTPFGLNSGLQAIHPLWAQKRLAVVANMGMLVQPTSRAQFLANAVPLPTNLFSHSDQVVQMQSGAPNTGVGTGWAGRVADAVTTGPVGFPPSVSLAGPQLFCTGNKVQSASLIPGFDLSLGGMSIWPQSAADGRKTAFQEMLTFDNGLALVQSANNVMSDAMALNGMLKSLSASGGLTTVFPGTSLGNQLKEVAKIMKLRGSLGVTRQVFFCSIGGFDTHGSQDWMHWDLLRQVGQAMNAFYNATVELGVADQVVTFTASEFGRTLQPSGAGSDHGWGNHQLVMGGAVKGGDVFGAFPTMALGGPDDTGSRGAMIPTTSVDQFGATLARWFGVPAASMPAIFPNLGKFAVQDLQFV